MTGDDAGALKLGILMATGLEAKPFIQGLDLERLRGFPCRIFSGPRVLLAVSGVGRKKTEAAVHVIAGAGVFAAINLGAAGATRRGIEEGTVFQAGQVIEYPGGGSEPVRFGTDTVGDIPACSLVTVDRAAVTEEERNELAGYGDLVDMEGSAFLRTCRQLGIPAHIFKYVSDTPDHASIPEILFRMYRLRDGFYRRMASEVLPMFFGQKPGSSHC